MMFFLTPTRKIVAALSFLAFWGVLAALVSPFTPRGAEAAEPTELTKKCGVVETLERTAFVLRDGREAELSAGSDVYQSDIIKTGQIGNARLRLVDDTLVNIGPTSEVALVSIVYSTRISHIFISIDRGSVALKQGTIALVNPGGVELTTPKTLISAGDADFSVTVTPSAETIALDRAPGGKRVSVYNVNTKELVYMTDAGTSLSTDSDNVMSVSRRDG